MTVGEYEVWLCDTEHECAPEGDMMCFTFNEKVFYLYACTGVRQTHTYQRGHDVFHLERAGTCCCFSIIFFLNFFLVPHFPTSRPEFETKKLS
jgi:hypothetical protein